MSMSEREADELGKDLVEIFDEHDRARAADGYHDSFLATVRAIAFELRDRLDTKPFFVDACAGQYGNAKCTYTRDVGLTIEVGERKLDIPESALEQHGLVVADGGGDA